MAREYQPKSEENRIVAERAANAIREYWLAKGVRAKVWVERQAAPRGSKQESIYVVKSEGIPCPRF